MRTFIITATMFLAVVISLARSPSVIAMTGTNEAEQRAAQIKADIAKDKEAIDRAAEKASALRKQALKEQDAVTRKRLMEEAESLENKVAEAEAAMAERRAEAERTAETTEQRVLREAMEQAALWNAQTLKKQIEMGYVKVPNDEPVLVIPNSVMKPEDRNRIVEEMTVMRGVLQVSLERGLGLIPYPDTGSRRLTTGRTGLFDSLAGSDRVPDIYIQGFGALFILEVDFPLAEPTKREEQEAEKEPDQDSLWEQVKNEMYETPSGVNNAFDLKTSLKRSNDYDPKQVEKLKRLLVSALRHATNMKGIQPDEVIVISVTNAGSAEDSLFVTGMTFNKDGKSVVMKDRRSRIVFSGKVPQSGMTIPHQATTTLTLRANKTDIDDFASGRIDGEKFRSRVQILVGCENGGVEDGNRKRR